jgi:sporulation protein YlmC with PRC-barrel domain
MRLDLGSPVRCTDEAFGELADVVIDPETRRVTHLVVQPHQRREQARLVPVDRARAGETSDATISLSCTIAEMSEFELVRESEYLRLGEIPVGDPDWQVGIEEPLALPPSMEAVAQSRVAFPRERRRRVRGGVGPR